MPTIDILFHPKILAVVSYSDVADPDRDTQSLMYLGRSLSPPHSARDSVAHVPHVTLYVRTPLTSASCVIAWTQSSATALCSSYPLPRDQYRPLRARSGFTKLHTLTMKKFCLAMTLTHQGARFRGYMR